MESRLVSRSIGALAFCLCLGLAHAEESRADLAREADRAYGRGRFEQAIDLYRKLLSKEFDADARKEAMLRLGMCQKELGRYRSAIETFEKILEGEPRDLRTGRILHGGFLSEPQWEIGNCYLLLKDYASALESYRKAKTLRPTRTGDGMLYAETEYRFDLYMGLCYEYLGQPDKALEHYWRQAGSRTGDPTIPLRLVHLYASSGRMDEFRALVNRRAADTVTESVLHLYTLGLKRKWPELISLVRGRGGPGGPEREDARRRNWPAVMAARQLAAAPDETVPLLLAATEKAAPARLAWLHLALGYCATPEALDVLVKLAASVDNYHDAIHVVYCLSVAGASGEARLIELGTTTNYNLAIALRNWRDGRFADTESVPFPPLEQPGAPQRPPKAGASEAGSSR